MTRRASLLVAVVPLLALAVLAVAQNRPADNRNTDAAAPAAGPNTRPATGPAAAKPATEPAMTHGRVIAVTIYQNSALVTHEVDVKGPAGLTEIAVTPLPPQTIDSSLYTEGTDGLRVLSTRYRTRAVKEDTREEVRALIEKMRQLDQAAREMRSQVEVLGQNQQMLSKLENFTAVTMQQLMEKGMFNADGTVKLSQFVMDQRAEKAKAITDLQEKIQANAEAQQFAQRQMGELTAGASRTERDAVIVVDKGNAADGKVRLNYLVTAATWRPMYKMRAPAGGKEKDPVTVEYLAEIVQQSGESWDDVAVTLSTAEPMLNAAPPDLLALDVTVSGGRVAANNPSTRPTLGLDNYNSSQSLRRQAQTELNANRGELGWQLGNDAAALEQTAELLAHDDERVVMAGPREGQSVTYHLKSRLTLPMRNDPQLIEVARTELQPDYFYKTVPVLSPHVYRLAVLTNKADSVLLPGEATMYLGTDFVGRMNLPLVAVGEQFTVGFGVDPQIQVARELINKTRSFQGGNQVLTFDYRIRVSSFKADDVKIQVWDRLPKGEQETVGIALLKTTPELSTDPTYVRADKPKNLLRWDLTVKPGSSGEKAATVDYQFKMEYARDVSIGNFKATK